MSSVDAIGKRTSIAAGRKRRVDLGTIRFSERDRELLGFIGEQFTVTVEQLAVLIGRRIRTARWLRDRWRTAGWVEGHQLLHDGASFIWLTREGARVARSRYRVWGPNVTMLDHIHAVTETRLLLERDRRLGMWRCERQLAKEIWTLPGKRPHLPDGVLNTSRGQIAVEIELTLKTRTRSEAIVANLGERYERVWYFAEPRLVPVLSEIAAASRWQNVRVHHCPPLPGELLA